MLWMYIERASLVPRISVFFLLQDLLNGLFVICGVDMICGQARGKAWRVVDSGYETSTLV